MAPFTHIIMNIGETGGSNLTGTFWDVVPALIIGAVMLLAVWAGSRK